MSSAPPESSVSAALERHHRRREQGIPTLTVLVGPPAGALAAWRHGLEGGPGPGCVSSRATAEGLLADWLEVLARARSLTTDAAEYLGAAAGMGPGELSTRLHGKLAYERDVLLQALLPHLPPGDVSTLCRRLLAQPRKSPSVPLPLAEVLAACEGDAVRALGAVHALVPAGTAPALLLSGEGEGWLDGAARVCARACERVPALVVALQAERLVLEAWLQGPESQARALVREGRVGLVSRSAGQLRERLEAWGVKETRGLEGSLTRLAAEGIPDAVLTHYGETARQLEAARREPEAVDRARSSAERFLYDLFDALPATHGVFELNGRTERPLQGRPMEVDFLSRRLRIALEVDGYHHFRGPEDYRRDRRKDLALQRQGYWVLRFLAEDVVSRYEEIRDTVLEVVSVRRQDLGGPPPRGGHGDEGR